MVKANKRMRRKAHRPLVLGVASFMLYQSVGVNIRKQLQKNGESFVSHVPDIVCNANTGNIEPNKEVNHQ